MVDGASLKVAAPSYESHAVTAVVIVVMDGAGQQSMEYRKQVNCYC